LEEHAALQLKHSRQKISVLENMIKVFFQKIIEMNLFNHMINPFGGSDQLIVFFNFNENGSSEAKQKARSEASRQNI